ncbi:MAG: formylglycine-generating enzyme family protein [Planctomycetaceae bacterium]
MTTRTFGHIVCRIVTSLSCLAGSCAVHAEDTLVEPATQKNAKDGSEMILIRGGSFLMGTSPAEIDEQIVDTGLPEDWKTHLLDEQPRHRRTVNPFYIYKYEVTNAQYKAFIDATDHRSPPHWNGKDYPAGKQKHPVVEVSWDDAQAYCHWAGTALPTEAQWEIAARGAEPAKGQSSRVFPWGNKWDYTLSNNSSIHAGKHLQNAADYNVWYEGDQKSQFPLTSAVGAFPKSVSPFGVHDMAGNAWEWCAEVQAPYPKQNAEDAEDKTLRARRGGSWANVALHIRSADRQPASHDNLNLFTGFRCVKRP